MTNRKAKISKEETVLDVAKKLFTAVGVEVSQKVSFDKENEVYLLDVNAGDAAGLLIGKRGDTINAFQIIINQIVRQNLGEWLRVVVNVNDFRQKETDRMSQIALQTAERVRETGQAQNLYNLTPSQRRAVHLTLSKEEDLRTESVGDGADRYLVVSKK